MKGLKYKLKKTLDWVNSHEEMDSMIVSLTKSELEHLLSSMGDGWVKVDKDNMPKGNILAIDNTGNTLTGLLFYRYRKFSCEYDTSDDETIVLSNVTHWQPISKPTP